MLKKPFLIAIISILLLPGIARAVDINGTNIESVDPSKEIQVFQQLMDRVFDKVSELNVPENETVTEIVEGHYSPSLDLVETNIAYVVKMDLPGMTKEQISIEFNDQGSLIISGVRKKVQPQGTIGNSIYKRSERSFGNFKRIVSLPNNIKSEGADAKYDQGVLEISIPKKAASSSKSVKLKVQ